MAKVSLKEASKTDWFATLNDGNNYPGDTNIQIGCLMRIAEATEKMASNYTRMENDLALYKRWYNEERAKVSTLTKRNNALRGYIKRQKNLLTPKP